MYPRYGKPLFDTVVALFLIILLFPLWVLLPCLILLTMGRPILFQQQRPGLNARPFTLYKFRTMSTQQDSNGRLLPDSERLGSVGRFLRRSSLDELPELFNVLKGEMSLIGPRPLLVAYLPLYSPEQMRRHHVRPGISGWAQINGRNAISWEEKFNYDLWYIDNISFWLDVKIALLTLYSVLARHNINTPGHSTTPPFTGNSS